MPKARVQFEVRCRSTHVRILPELVSIFGDHRCHRPNQPHPTSAIRRTPALPVSALTFRLSLSEISFRPTYSPRLHPLRKKATAASGANDLRVWRVRDGQLLHRMDVHTAGVTSVAFSRDGRMLASGSYDTTAKLWSAQNGALQYNLAYDAPVRTVAFGPDGRSLSAGGGDQKIAFWRLEPAPLNSSNTR